MSWIESHQSLSSHRKTIKAARLLKCDKHKLIGHLHELWWWGLDNASDNGELTGIERADVALAAQWKGDPETFIVVLIEAGFVDSDPTGKWLALHNWWQFAGKLNAKRARDRERKSPGSSAEVHRNSSGSSAEVAGTVPTVPTDLPTERNGARAAWANAFEGGPPPPPPVIAAYLDHTAREASCTAWWRAYPQRSGGHWGAHEAAARQAWREHVADGEEAACMAKLEDYMRSRDVQEGVIMAPENWLPGWRDQTAAKPKPASAKDANTAPNYLRAAV